MYSVSFLGRENKFDTYDAPRRSLFRFHGSDTCIASFLLSRKRYLYRLFILLIEAILDKFVIVYYYRYRNKERKIVFENIIGQKNVTSLLSNDISKGALPNSLIFHGDNSTGKLTTALELVKILNCKTNGSHDCECSNCKRIESLDFEGLIFLSRRDFYFYIKEYANSYKILGDKKYLQKLLKYAKLQFLPLQDFLIKDVFTDAEKKQIQSYSEEIYDAMTKESLDADMADKIAIAISEINALYKKQNIPVDSIRATLDWSYINQPDINRCVIIDQIDYLEDSSRNILLKRLEEPSKNLFFILIAENKNRIIQTILSRCRAFYFQRLGERETAEVLQREFGENSIYKTVEDFLYRHDQTSFNNILPTVEKIINYVFIKEHSFLELEAFLQKFNDKKIAKALLRCASVAIERELLDRELDSEINENIKILRNVPSMRLHYIKEFIQDKYKKMDIFGLNPVWSLEGVFYPLKGLALNDKL